MERRSHPFVVIEGMDGAGKKSQAKSLVEWFHSLERKAVYLDFPRYDSLSGKAVLGHLKREWFVADASGKRAPEDELVFQFGQTINRYEFAQEIIDTLKHTAVICDRYSPSGRVYGAVNGIPRPFLKEIHRHLPQPDICILLDIPVSESFTRRPERRDRYEEQEWMLEKVRTEYLTLFREEQWHVVDGTGSFEEVRARVQRCIPASMAF